MEPVVGGGARVWASGRHNALFSSAADAAAGRKHKLKWERVRIYRKKKKGKKCLSPPTTRATPSVSDLTRGAEKNFKRRPRAR